MPGGKGVQFDVLHRAVRGVQSDEDVDINIIAALKHSGLVVEDAGTLRLPEDLAIWLQEPTKEKLAQIFDLRYLLFSETLEALKGEPSTYDELLRALREKYDIHWETKYPVTTRVNWLEELELCEAIGWRKYRITEVGAKFLQEVLLVSPEVTDYLDEGVELAPAPLLIASMLANINQIQRSKTYKASPFFPGEDPVDSIRKAVEWAEGRITKSQFISECSSAFGISESSVGSFLHPLLNYGLLDEVGRGLYESTAPAVEWINSYDDLNLVRILHSRARFIGELIASCRDKTERSEVYRIGEKYGVGSEYCKQFIKVLVSVGVLEEPGYLRLRATAIGLRLVETLPLAIPLCDDSESNGVVSDFVSDDTGLKISDLVKGLTESSKDPKYDGKALGLAFEEYVCEAFKNMGFSAMHIGGTGDTDVLVKWTGPDGEFHSAVIDAKSRSDGVLSHADISSALEPHKKKNNADHIAVIGYEFSGPTVRDVAAGRSIQLISVQELADVMEAASELGIPTYQSGMLFSSASELGELIEKERRMVSLIPQVIEAFDDDVDDEPGLSIRDVYLSLRKTKASPSKEELSNIVELLSNPAIGALVVMNTSDDPQYIMYAVSDLRASSRRLAALAVTLGKAQANGTE